MSLYYYQISVELEFSRRILEKKLNIKFNENPYSGSRIVPFRQTEVRTDGRQTQIVKVKVAFHNFETCIKTFLQPFRLRKNLHN